MEESFISGVSGREFRSRSFFRSFQHRFLAEHAPSCRGLVLEIGAEPGYGHDAYFGHASGYLASNIAGPADVILDATALGVGTGSVDTVVCVSVLEHVLDQAAAFSEIGRVVRPGGRLLLTVPFAYPIHDRIDFWRFTDQSLVAQLEPDFEVEKMVRLGGKISTVASLLQRPIGKYTKRHLPAKAMGLVFASLMGRFDQPDDAPLGFGVVARRR